MIQKCFFLVCIVFFAFSVHSEDIVTPEELQVRNETDRFFTPQPDSDVSIKVLVTADTYSILHQKGRTAFRAVVSQYRSKRFSALVKKYGIVNLTREAKVELGVSRGSGRVNRVITVSSTFVRELDKMIIKDLAGWRFRFYQRRGSQKKILVLYRICLKKKMQ